MLGALTLMIMIYERVLHTCCLEESFNSLRARHLGRYNDLMTVMCERVLPTCCLKDPFIVKWRESKRPNDPGDNGALTLMTMMYDGVPLTCCPTTDQSWHDDRHPSWYNEPDDNVVCMVYQLVDLSALPVHKRGGWWHHVTPILKFPWSRTGSRSLTCTASLDSLVWLLLTLL